MPYGVNALKVGSTQCTRRTGKRKTIAQLAGICRVMKDVVKDTYYFLVSREVSSLPVCAGVPRTFSDTTVTPTGQYVFSRNTFLNNAVQLYSPPHL